MQTPVVEVPAHQLLELAPDLLDEVAGEDGTLAGHPPPRDPEGGAAGVLGRVGRDAVLLSHEREHEVAPGPGLVRVAARVVMGRRLGQGREQRGLGEAQLARADAEVMAGRGLDAPGPVPEIDAVGVWVSRISSFWKSV